MTCIHSPHFVSILNHITPQTDALRTISLINNSGALCRQRKGANGQNATLSVNVLKASGNSGAGTGSVRASGLT